MLKKQTQAESNSAEDADTSRYYEKHKDRPTCPYCGAIMHFTNNYYYEGHDHYWGCPECGCLLGDEEDFSESIRKGARTRLRAQFKEEIEKRERGLVYYRAKLKLWGKYMSDQEKVRLLAEAIEDQPTDSN